MSRTEFVERLPVFMYRRHGKTDPDASHRVYARSCLVAMLLAISVIRIRSRLAQNCGPQELLYEYISYKAVDVVVASYHISLSKPIKTHLIKHPFLLLLFHLPHNRTTILLPQQINPRRAKVAMAITNIITKIMYFLRLEQQSRCKRSHRSVSPALGIKPSQFVQVFHHMSMIILAQEIQICEFEIVPEVAEVPLVAVNVAVGC